MDCSEASPRCGVRLGVEYEGEWRLPRFQFERKKVLPSVAAVLFAVPAELNPLDVVMCG
jgi:hypothetical protein